MVIIILEKVSASVRGELTRWLTELKTGVFIGNISALVRDKLWEMVCGKLGAQGGAYLVHNCMGEQGYIIKTWGEPSRLVADFEGIQLVRRYETQTNRKRATKVHDT